MRIVDNTEIKIWLGLREGYSEKIHDPSEVREFLSEIINENPICLSITPTEFLYKDGWEPGVVIGLINYSRFPKESDEIRIRALDIANKLMKKFRQRRVSLTLSNELAGSIMLENEEL